MARGKEVNKWNCIIFKTDNVKALKDTANFQILFLIKFLVYLSMIKSFNFSVTLGNNVI